jgi:hypothetical protein
MKNTIFVLCCCLFFLACGGSNNNFWTDARDKMAGQWQFTIYRSVTPIGQATTQSSKTFLGAIAKQGTSESDIRIDYYSHDTKESAFPHIYNSNEFYSYTVDSVATKEVKGQFSSSFYNISFVYTQADSTTNVRDSVVGYKMF